MAEVSRRAVLNAGAWSIPVVSLAVAAPAASASAVLSGILESLGTVPTAGGGVVWSFRLLNTSGSASYTGVTFSDLDPLVISSTGDTFYRNGTTFVTTTPLPDGGTSAIGSLTLDGPVGSHTFVGTVTASTGVSASYPVTVTLAEPSTGTTSLSQEYYSTQTFYGGTFVVTGQFALSTGSTYPLGSEVTVSFEDPLPLTVDGPITVDASNGALSFTVVFDPVTPPEYSETVMTVSAPGFASATAIVWVPEPD